MDPITAALQLVSSIIQLQIVTINAMSESDRAAYAKIQLEQLQKWQEFLDRIVNIFHPNK